MLRPVLTLGLVFGHVARLDEDAFTLSTPTLSWHFTRTTP